MGWLLVGDECGSGRWSRKSRFSQCLRDGVWGLNKTGDSELARHVGSLWFIVAEEMAWLAKVLMVLSLLVR